MIEPPKNREELIKEFDRLYPYYVKIDSVYQKLNPLIIEREELVKKSYLGIGKFIKSFLWGSIIWVFFFVWSFFSNNYIVAMISDMIWWNFAIIFAIMITIKMYIKQYLKVIDFWSWII